MMKIEVDAQSGFCGGVIRAIGIAEKSLAARGKLLSLGEIVHNEEELSRLQSLGLETVDSLSSIPQELSGVPVLVRAHGVPPSVYSEAREKGIELLDCTCPVVLRLQKAIREAYESVRSRGGQIVIFGKIGHPEVLGLVGQTGGDVVVAQSTEHLRDLVASSAVDTGKDIELFSQTTMSPAEYRLAGEYLSSVMRPGAVLNVHDTICSQVASRHEQLSRFAASHDVVVFVSGKSSSNGKVLYELCRSVNARTFQAGGERQLRPEWFAGASSVGVCGATSTPKWLLDKVAGAIENLSNYETVPKFVR